LAFSEFHYAIKSDTRKRWKSRQTLAKRIRALAKTDIDRAAALALDGKELTQIERVIKWYYIFSKERSMIKTAGGTVFERFFSKPSAPQIRTQQEELFKLWNPFG
jgi:hypothetical protein